MPMEQWNVRISKRKINKISQFVKAKLYTTAMKWTSGKKLSPISALAFALSMAQNIAWFISKFAWIGFGFVLDRFLLMNVIGWGAVGKLNDCIGNDQFVPMLLLWRLDDETSNFKVSKLVFLLGKNASSSSLGDQEKNNVIFAFHTTSKCVIQSALSNVISRKTTIFGNESRDSSNQLTFFRFEIIDIAIVVAIRVFHAQMRVVDVDGIHGFGWISYGHLTDQRQYSIESLHCKTVFQKRSKKNQRKLPGKWFTLRIN